jgi:hypothetical protein
MGGKRNKPGTPPHNQKNNRSLEETKFIGLQILANKSARGFRQSYRRVLGRSSGTLSSDQDTN